MYPPPRVNRVIALLKKIFNIFDQNLVSSLNKMLSNTGLSHTTERPKQKSKISERMKNTVLTLNYHQCCESGIRCLFDPWIRDLEQFYPGSQTHIFESLMTIFCVKSSIILCKLTKSFFFASSKIKLFLIL
jgi:hypothetical protein